MKNQTRQNTNRSNNSNHSQASSGQTGGKSGNQSSPNKQANNSSSVDMKIQGGSKGGEYGSGNQSVNKSNASSNQSNNKSNFNNSNNSSSNNNSMNSSKGGNSKSNSSQNASGNSDKRNSLGSGGKNVKSHNSGGGNNSSSTSNYKGPMLVLGAPTYDLPNKDQPFESEKKFTGRCRLFVANLPSNVTEDSLRSLFQQYGQVSEVFLGKQNSFAFVKMDTRKHAEEARSTLDNKTYEGKTLRVRLAAHAAAVRVKNLSHMVTNELLEYAFSYFGEVERAIVITDDRGRSIGEGIVEFARKSSAQNCIKKCSTECFLLTSNPAPVYIESLEQRDEDEGFGEKNINKNSPEFRLERELGPRFADPQTFEYEFACRFKQLYEIEKERRSRLENEIQEARHALLNQLELQRTEHQTKLLKEKLREMEEKVAHFDEIRNRTLEQEKMREQERVQQEMLLRQREEEILRPGPIQDYAMLRRQENDLRQQAIVLQDMLDRREGALRMNELPPQQQQPPQQMYPPPMHHQPINHPDQGYQQQPPPPPMMDPAFGDHYNYNGMNSNGAPPMEMVGNRYGPVASQSGYQPAPLHDVSYPPLGGSYAPHHGPIRGVGDGGTSQLYHNRPAPYASNKGRNKKF